MLNSGYLVQYTHMAYGHQHMFFILKTTLVNSGLKCQILARTSKNITHLFYIRCYYGKLQSDPSTYCEIYM